MEISARQIGSVTIVDMGGKLTRGVGDRVLREKVDDLLANGARRIVLNLEMVPYMDSAGIGEVVGCAKRAAGMGSIVKLVNPHRRVYDLLHLVKLDMIFEIHTAEEEALRSFDSGPLDAADPA